MKNSRYTKENIEAAIKGSNSIKECLVKLGLKYTHSGNYQTFHRHCAIYGIETPKFDYSSITSAAIMKNTIPLEEILVENSTSAIKNQSLKGRLIRENLIEDVCSKCGVGNTWNGEALVLQLDHINGVNNDNRLENLRVLCPNCHSQTSTFCSRSGRRKKEKEKRDPNKYVPKPTIRKVVNRPPYEVLLEETSSLGYVKTGKKYGVSDNAVRKWIKYYKKELNMASHGNEP